MLLPPCLTNRPLLSLIPFECLCKWFVIAARLRSRCRPSGGEPVSGTPEHRRMILWNGELVTVVLGAMHCTQAFHMRLTTQGRAHHEPLFVTLLCSGRSHMLFAPST